MRKKKNIKAASELVWWQSFLLAILVIVIGKVIIPNVAIANPLLKPFLYAFAGFSPAISGVLLTISGISLMKHYKRKLKSRSLFNQQTGSCSVNSLSWGDFERLVGEKYRREGYAVTENRRPGSDGGVDLELRKNHELILVQCKHWKSRSVGSPVVRELLGAMTAKSASGGIVATSGKFTKSAISFAKDTDIVLLDGNELAALFSNQIGSDVTARRADALCPECGSKMVMRKAKSGPNEGKRFLGCTRFPSCRSTIAI